MINSFPLPKFSRTRYSSVQGLKSPKAAVTCAGQRGFSVSFYRHGIDMGRCGVPVRIAGRLFSSFELRPAQLLKTDRREASKTGASAMSSADPYAGRPYLLAASRQNADLARAANLEDEKQIDITDIASGLGTSPMFRALYEEFQADGGDMIAAQWMCARVYAAGLQRGGAK